MNHVRRRSTSADVAALALLQLEIFRAMGVAGVDEAQWWETARA
ncbi:hypothetical protein [Actinomyces haliotis]|nr:hypothetical protein [Actinomyces haliotis]